MIDLETIRAEIDVLFAGDHSGHDAMHTVRVYRSAMAIAQKERCDRDVVALGALLHDVDDEKLFQTTDYANARRIMVQVGVEPATADRVVAVIRDVSFRGTDTVTPDSIEGKIVQDADRLDAIGAIGIARAFAYGGSRGRTMYDPSKEPVYGMDAGAYRRAQGTTLNHFYEKLFLLKEMMNTRTAKALAEHRDAVMHAFVDEFLGEWEGRC